MRSTCFPRRSFCKSPYLFPGYCFIGIVLLVVASFAVAGCGGGGAKGGGGGSTGGSGGSGGTGGSGTVTFAQRNAIMDQTATKWASLPHQNDVTDAQTMLAYLKTVAGVTSSGIDVDNNIWCTCADGQPLVFVNNEPESDPYSQDGSSPPAGKAAVRGVITHSPNLAPAGSRDAIAIPSGQYAVLLNMFGQYSDPKWDPRWDGLGGPGLTYMVKYPGGYNAYPTTQTEGAANIALLRTLFNQSNRASVVFATGHGGFIKGHYHILSDQQIPFKPGPILNPLYEGNIDTSGEKSDPKLTADLNPQAKYGGESAVVRSFAMYVGKNGKPGYEWHYGYTSLFVHEYMFFKPNSIYYNGACYGMHAASAEFMLAAFNNGLYQYLGWDSKVVRMVADNAARYLFDRMGGANTFMPQFYANRPFDSFTITAAMAQKSPPLTVSLYTPPKAPSTVYIAHLSTANSSASQSPPSPLQGVILAPSISGGTLISGNGYLPGNPKQDILGLQGSFGSNIPGASLIITVGGTPLTSKPTWSSNQITVTLPDSGDGSNGNVIVYYNGHRSNPAQLTDWSLPISVTHKGNGTETWTSNWKLHLRGMLNAFRTQPDTPPATPPYVTGGLPLVAGEDSVITWNASGSYTTGKVTDTISGSSPPDIPLFQSIPDFNTNVAYAQPQISNSPATFYLTIFESASYTDKLSNVAQPYQINWQVDTSSPGIPGKAMSNTFDIISTTYTPTGEGLTVQWPFTTPTSPPNLIEAQ